MDIYEKIDTIFSGEAEERPQWASELLDELKEIKALLKEHKQPRLKRVTSYNNTEDLYAFIKEFRDKMKADTANNNYPTFNYRGKKLGVDFKGLLYDKETTRTLRREEAFKIYRYAYNLHQDGKNIA